MGHCYYSGGKIEKINQLWSFWKLYHQHLSLIILSIRSSCSIFFFQLPRGIIQRIGYFCRLAHHQKTKQPSRFIYSEPTEKVLNDAWNDRKKLIERLIIIIISQRRAKLTHHTLLSCSLCVLKVCFVIQTQLRTSLPRVKRSGRRTN